MLVLKNKGISLLESEKKTLISFLLFYSFFSLIILLFIASIYYNLQRDVMLQKQRTLLQEYSNVLIKELRYLHDNFDKTQEYPRFKEFNSAIYDSSKKKIFSLLSENEKNLNKNIYKIGEKIHFIRLLESYYLGAMYVVIEIDDDEKWLAFYRMEVMVFGLILFVMFLVVGYFLSKQLLKPMRDSMYLLDRFIKDTTHELNTPVAAILTNIEMINQNRVDPSLIKKINRINIAAKTISNIYNDLTYIALNNQIQSDPKDINLTLLVKERVEFFRVIANSKKITFIEQIDKDIFLFIDQIKISRLVDNLLSNAIKYNKREGFIKIILKNGLLIVEDSGVGIPKDKIKQVYDRYTRFNSSEGGFGLGLNIVMSIAKEFNLNVNIDSKVGVGTKVSIKW